MTSEKIESEIKKLPKRKSPEHKGFTGDFYHAFRN